MITNTNNFTPRNGQMSVSYMLFTRNNQLTKLDSGFTSNTNINDLLNKNE
jgi:hypothetical protein